MNLISAVLLLCALLSTSRASLVSLSPGLPLGLGFTLHLDQIDEPNGTLLEQHAVRLDYSGIGVSVGKMPRKEAVQLDFFVKNDQEEGRGKKMGEISLPVFLGFKLATVVSLGLMLVATLVLKALGIAKLALITSAIALISKLMHGEEDGGPHQAHSLPAYVEIDPLASEQHPSVTQYSSSTAGNNPSETANYYAYSNYAPANVANYATAEAAGDSNATGATSSGNQQVAVVQASKRRDLSRRKLKLPMFTIHRYSSL